MPWIKRCAPSSAWTPNNCSPFARRIRWAFVTTGIHVNGDIDIIDDFVFPELHSLSMGPESLRRFMRKYVIQRPVLDAKICKTCGECWHICPAKAISHDVRGVRIDMDQCIRCYCCIEVCPHAAIFAKEPLLGKLRRRLVTKADNKQKIKSGHS